MIEVVVWDVIRTKCKNLVPMLLLVVRDFCHDHAWRSWVFQLNKGSLKKVSLANLSQFELSHARFSRILNRLITKDNGTAEHQLRHSSIFLVQFHQSKRSLL
jgi:hypothetical protein